MAKEKVQKKVSERKKKKKAKKVFSPKVLFRIRSTYNNTIVSVTDYDGNVIVSSSTGGIGFSGSKKATAYAATKTGEDASQKAFALGAREAEVIVKGVGIGRQAAVKGIRSGGIKITMLSDRTSVPHGGCKPRKKPRK